MSEKTPRASKRLSLNSTRPLRYCPAVNPITPMLPIIPIRTQGISLLALVSLLAAIPASAQSSASATPSSSLLGEILVVILGLSLSVICVLMHYEALGLITRFLPRLGTRPRPRILILMIALLAVHQAEVWMFAWGYFFAGLSGIMGKLVGADGHLLTYAYYSTTTYTTLGYGDITPTGPIRFLASVEALTGFLLVTWSASFTYLEMQRFWRDK